MWSGYVLGRVRLLGIVLIGLLGGGDFDGGLEMGQAGPFLVFVVLLSLGSTWRQGLAMLLYDLFSLVIGNRHLFDRVCSGPDSIDWWIMIGRW